MPSKRASFLIQITVSLHLLCVSIKDTFKINLRDKYDGIIY